MKYFVQKEEVISHPKIVCTILKDCTFPSNTLSTLSRINTHEFPVSFYMPCMTQGVVGHCCVMIFMDSFSSPPGLHTHKQGKIYHLGSGISSETNYWHWTHCIYASLIYLRILNERHGMSIVWLPSRQGCWSWIMCLPPHSSHKGIQSKVIMCA